MIHWSNASQSERIAVLSQLFSSGLGRTEAAEQLGITVHAVSGFCFRHHLRPNPRVGTEWERLATAAARLARVKELDGLGLNAKQIGAELGVSQATIYKLISDARTPLMNSGPRSRPMPTLPVLPDLPPETWLPVCGLPLSMLEITDTTCRWPIEIDGVPQGYCGQHVDRGSYCAHHYAVAYRPAGTAPAPERPEPPKKRRPIASAAAMEMAGVPARRMEAVE